MTKEQFKKLEQENYNRFDWNMKLVIGLISIVLSLSAIAFTFYYYN